MPWHMPLRGTVLLLPAHPKLPLPMPQNPKPPNTPILQITATNVHNAISDKAVSKDVVVGLPDAPTLGAITPDVGKATISWSAAATNAAIGTR